MATLDELRSALQDRYQIEREIGAGGMATVYRALDVKHRRAVAIKVLRPELAASLGTERFLREIELAAQLQHPHILPLYDSGSAAGFLYYVMPFVEGESLRDRLSRDTCLPAETAVELVREVASALAYAHERDVIHRDIKPENILISGGHAVVADFGIARAVNAASSGQRLTGIGLSIGTPAYMSPEQATASEEVDGRSDIYSLGCVLFEALCGQPAFSGPSIQSVITKSISGPRPHARSVQKTVPEAIDQVITRALAQDPAARYQTATEFSDALGRALLGEMSRGRRWVPIAVGVATAVLLFAGWLGYRAWAQRSPVRTGAERIAVMPFSTVGTGVELLGEGMVDLLSTNLNAVGGIETVDPRLVLNRWHKGSGSGQPDPIAIGRALEAGSVLTGSVVSAGSSVRINAELTGVTGETLARAQVNGSPDNVIGLVDSLSLALLRNIWRSRQPLPSLRVGAITSNSVDAIRAYMQGEQFYRRAEWDSAVAAFTRAIEADSTFALANFRLALSIGWTGGWQAPKAIEATEAAYRNIKRLPERDQDLINGYRLFTHADVAAIDSLRSYVNQYPKDVDGWFMLADAQYHLRPIRPLAQAELLAPFDSVIRLDPSLVAAYFHPMEIVVADRDSAAYHRYLRKLDSAAPNANLEQYAYLDQLVWGPEADSALAAEWAQHAGGATGAALMARLDEDESDPESVIRVSGTITDHLERGSQAWNNNMTNRAAVLLGLGRVKAALALGDTLRAVNAQMAGAIPLMPIQMGLAPTGSAPFTDQMRQGIERAAVSNFFPASFYLAYLLASGDAATARRVIDLINAPANPAYTPEMKSMINAYRGWARMVEGDTAGGITEMKAGLSKSGLYGVDWNSSHLRFRLAEAMARRPATRDEGISMLLNGFESGTDLGYVAQRRLVAARALEDKGDRAGAAVQYGAFIRLWAGADSTLQPLVAEARQGLERNTGEPH